MIDKSPALVAVSALPVKSPVTSPTTSPVTLPVKLPLNVVAVMTPAAALIPVELIVTAVPTIAELKVETPVTLRSSSSVCPSTSVSYTHLTLPTKA